MTASHEKTLLWLEDIPKSVESLIIFARTVFTVKCVSQLHDFAKIIKKKPKAIVLDIMLNGVYNLDDLGVEKKNLDLDLGYEAGWGVLEHYLRAPNSDFKHIPVLILSCRTKREKDRKLLDRLNQQESAASITFLEKLGDVDWYEQFEKWIYQVDMGRVQ